MVLGTLHLQFCPQTPLNVNVLYFISLRQSTLYTAHSNQVLWEWNKIMIISELFLNGLYSIQTKWVQAWQPNFDIKILIWYRGLELHRGEKVIQKLKKVHRKVAQLCASNYNHCASVREMLHYLNWETPATRRKTARLTSMYKLSHNLRDFFSRSPPKTKYY